MDVQNRIRSTRPILLAACLLLTTNARVQADPLYTAIDLGSAPLTYGTDSSGDGTVIGSNGQAYVFNASQNLLPMQWVNNSQGVPIVEPAPTWSQDTYGNPAYAHSTSTLAYMNSTGLAAGLNEYGVSGHLGNYEAFITQQQPNGTWGAPIALWSGSQTFDGSGPYNVGLMGVSANGQVLGYGVSDPNWTGPENLYLYDTKTQTLTNLTNIVDSMKWTNAQALPAFQSPTWLLASVVSQIDDQGRILVQATEGYSGPAHELLLVPQGVSSDPIATPEPATWAIFATLIGGYLARHRLRPRTRPASECPRG